MKKFYAIAAMLLCVAVSFAMPKVQGNYQLRPDGMQKLQKSFVTARERVANFETPKYSYTDKQNNTWNMFMYPMSPVWEAFSGGTLTKKTFPAYLVLVSVYSNEAQAQYQFVAYWPTYACGPKYFDKNEWSKEGGVWAKTDQAVADLGEEKAYSPMTPADAISAYQEIWGDNQWKVLEDAPGGQFYLGLFCAGSPSLQEATNNKSEVKGTEVTVSTDSYFQLKSYDNDLSEFSCLFDGTCSNSSTFYIDYAGEGTSIGFEHANRTADFAEVHLFDVGIIDYDTPKYGEMFMDEFTPVHGYFIAACNAAMCYDYPGEQPGTPAETQDGIASYTATQLPENGPFAQSNGIRQYYQGMIYASEDATNYWGKYTCSKDFKWEIEDNVAMNLPVAYQFFPGGYNLDPSKLGLKGVVVDGFYSYPEVGKDQAIGFGDKEHGFWGRLEDHMDNSISWNFTNDIIFHNNPKNFLKAQLEDSIGDRDDVAVESIFGGNAEVVSSEYYNMQGVRLNAAPENGLYIVRNTLSNGKVTSKKVMK